MIFGKRSVINLGESTTKYSGLKWSIQLTQAQADAAERARRLTGFSRQELLSKALEEFIARHESEWMSEFQKQFAVTDNDAAKSTKK